MLVAAFLHTSIERQHGSDHSESLVHKVSSVPHTLEYAVDSLDSSVVQAFVVVDVLGIIVEAFSDALHEGFVACHVPCELLELLSVLLIVNDVQTFRRPWKGHSDKKC